MPFSIVTGDILDVHADAVVVPANEQLVIDGGVGLKVALAAGRRKLQRACDAQGGCETGAAVVTPAYSLRARHVVHVVGPIWQGGDAGEEALLAQAYESALDAAYRAGDSSVALPLISAGTYGYPAEEAIAVAVRAIRAFLDGHEMDITLVLYDRRAVRAGLRNAADLSRYLDEAHFDMGFEAPAAAPSALIGGVTQTFPANRAGLLDKTREKLSSAGWDFGSTERLAPEADEGEWAGGQAERTGSPEADPWDACEASRVTRELEEAEAPVAFEAMRQPEGAEAFEAPNAPERTSEDEGFPRVFCPKCGCECAQGAWFCPHCGSRLQRLGLDGIYSTGAIPPYPDEGPGPRTGWDAPASAAQASACEAPSYLPAAQMPASFAAAPEPPSASCPAPKASAGPGITLGHGRKPRHAAQARRADLDAWLEQADESLADTLLGLIDERGFTDAQVYKRANISRQVFNKIKNDPGYHPKKPTVLALCVALELDVPATEDVLSRAGYALNPSSRFDLIVQYYISRGCFDHFEINEALFAYDQPLLGAG